MIHRGDCGKVEYEAKRRSDTKRRITNHGYFGNHNVHSSSRVPTARNTRLIGSSIGMRRALNEVRTVAPTDSAVLIQGETGTGKELIARAVHDQSSRKHEPFVTLNCAAIPSGLLESELFGHERGAYTGALNSAIGRFQMAHQGTLFLDEIGDMPLELQPKLLRVLQEQEFERLGSTRTIHVDVRIVAATNRDLSAMVQERRVPRGSVLPAARVPHRASASPRAHGRHPASGAALRRKVRRPHEQADPHHS